MTRDILTFATQNTADGKRVALITVTNIYGSSPSSAGQIMAVLPDGSSMGTVGGGVSEHRLTRMAVEAIQNGAAVIPFSVDHAEEGMSCGGRMDGFINVLDSGTGLAIFGGGHIAQSLAKIATQTGFFVTVIEDRPEFATAFDGVHYVLCEPDDYPEANPAAGYTYAVICTRGHKTDAEALRYCLTRPFQYVGMIGSAKKAAEVLQRMEDDGISQGELRRVYTPIGLDIASQIPAEIAVAILAEILLVKNGGSLRHKRD